MRVYMSNICHDSLSDCGSAARVTGSDAQLQGNKWEGSQGLQASSSRPAGLSAWVSGIDLGVYSMWALNLALSFAHMASVLRSTPNAFYFGFLILTLY